MPLAEPPACEQAASIVPLAVVCHLLGFLVPPPPGAWSSQLASWLPDSCPDVYSGLKVHSIVLADPQQHTTADALFLAYR